MSRGDSDLLIKDILLAIEKINKYTHEINFESFLQNDMIKDAVVRNIEIIGEAANRVSAEIKQNSDNIPWTKLRGIRNRIVHDYFGIDYKIIWFIIENELDPLKNNLQKLLSK